MSKTETQNETTWTPAELAYRDQLVLAAMQGDWAADTSEGITTRGLYADRARFYYMAAEAVLLERRKHGLPEDRVPTPHTHAKEDVIKDWRGIPHTPGASNATQDKLDKQAIDKIPGCGNVVQPLAGHGITYEHPAARDPRLQDGRDMDRQLTIDDFPPGTLIRFQGQDPRSWQVVLFATPHQAKLGNGNTMALSDIAGGVVLKRYEVALSHDGGKTWS